MKTMLMILIAAVLVPFVVIEFATTAGQGHLFGDALEAVSDKI